MPESFAACHLSVSFMNGNCACLPLSLRYLILVSQYKFKAMEVKRKLCKSMLKFVRTFYWVIETCTSKVRKCQEIDVKFEDHVVKVLYMMARCYESWILPISECIASLSKDE